MTTEADATANTSPLNTTAFSDEELLARYEAAEQAIHSAEMEGLSFNAEGLAVFRDYVEGRISVEQGIAEARRIAQTFNYA